MKMGRIIFFLIGLLIIQFVDAQQTDDFYFYSKDDIRNIRLSAKTEWGSTILKNLENTIKEREKHSLEIPVLEGGHGHHYFCPIHNTQFLFDWDSPKSHYCTVCKKNGAE